MDLTDIGGALKKTRNFGLSTPPKKQEQSNFVAVEMEDDNQLGVPENPHAKAFRKDHWTIDKNKQDGQIKAGEVDESQEEFLKSTEWIE